MIWVGGRIGECFGRLGGEEEGEFETNDASRSNDRTNE